MNLFDQMVADGNQCHPNETGGILLGQSSLGSFRVMHTIGAGPEAEHYSRSFTPDRDWQYDQIDEIWAKTGGKIEYLGDWHTHPTGAPIPSNTDQTLLRRTAGNPACQCPHPLMLILGQQDGTAKWMLAGFWYAPSKHEVKGSLIRVDVQLV
ncbi:Mov34/MPN/PAD-1 family protein [Kocuria oceani]|uniref:Mov34/MPN/PAD-1 family protein n=1 Tax=Kocuria oceani TaxID=988827 RepID=A0ABV9TNC0_9MICC|nr:Mov34/MPN/PAD-1 family protein [Kocuria oceani]